MKEPRKEPVITVWRNKIPHQCTLIYWGRKWRFRNDTPYKRLIHLRRMHIWTVHSPVTGGETIVTKCPEGSGWHMFTCYHADGSPLTFGEPTEVPGQ